MQKPNIQGNFVSVPVTSSSPAVFGRLAVMEIKNDYTLAEEEVADVDTPGVCLIELPNGDRHVAHIAEGRITGPATLLDLNPVWPGETACKVKMISREKCRLEGEMPYKPATSRERFTLRNLLCAACGAMAIVSWATCVAYMFALIELSVPQLGSLLSFGLLNLVFYFYLFEVRKQHEMGAEQVT
ncbi:hypothetical protein KUV57_12165 [Epibacterium sp. DP7N7-1]|nr:hypothetical protein [Epibacterium sp. DP7N7-1]